MSEQALWLAIDTSTATMAGAIVSGEQLLASVQTESERNHSIHIMTNIEKLLESSHVQLHQLNGIITGIGPGSYTGVRIAVTAAKTLAWTSNKPVIGVSSLAALALSGFLAEAKEHSLKTGRMLVLPIMDARRGQVYTAAFQFAEDRSNGNRLHSDHIVLMEDWGRYWIDQLTELQAQGVSYIAWFGDVAIHEASIARLKEAAAAYDIAVAAAPHPIIGQAIAMLGQGTWLDERVEATEQHELVPNYAQLTEAEVKQNAKEREEGKA